ncbi:PREDICTED: melanoma-associated antigen B4-like [Elephantulus edwardii]|uniref:melanoma-associated antigen B4-like n=1 Tax=Elephantulus edwardii TaxID=28737 RepID=UPI0003F085A9|nr:PREDICTED: melanoma-associated antigen B4-like [Elephantulus edwardii]
MPRSRKSKLCALGKNQRVPAETCVSRGAQAYAVEEEVSPLSPPLEDTPEDSPGAAMMEELGSIPAITIPPADGDAKSQDEEMPGPSQPSSFTDLPRKDPLTRKASMLVQYMLHNYKKNEPILKENLLKTVDKKYQEHFSEIMRRATNSRPSLNSEGVLSSRMGVPMTDFLMILLGMIFVNGNRAPEEEVWEFLKVLEVYPGRRYSIFGEPRKIITKDLVEEKYIVYQQVPNSDPPKYESLWGLRAYAETSKMKVLEVLAKINDTVPSTFRSLYEEVLREEEERAQARTAARATNPEA